MNLKKSIGSVVLACSLLLVSAASQAASAEQLIINAVSDDGDTAVVKLVYVDSLCS